MMDVLCLSSLIFDEKFFRRVLPFLKTEYFETPGSQQVFEVIRQFSSDYGKQPNKQAIAVILDSTKMPEMVFNQAIDCLDSIESTDTDTEFMVKSVEEWCKNRALLLAMQQAIEIMDGMDKDDQQSLSRSAIPDLITKANSVSFDGEVGRDYFEKAEEQYHYYHDEEARIPFPIPSLNRVTNGGYKKKTLNVVQAGINVGKTTFLVWLAAEALKAGMNVLYFTLEIDDKTVHERIDTVYLGYQFNELRKLTRDEYLNRHKSMNIKKSGKLIIKEYPADTANANHFRHIINEAKMKKGFVPDLIVIDYLTIATSAKLSNKARTNSDQYYTAVASEIRAIGQEFDVPIWTASQLTRSGQASDDVSITDGGLSLGIAKTADFMFVMMQPEELQAENLAICKVIKNRYANRTAFKKFKVMLINERQTIRDVDDGGVFIEGEQAPRPVQAGSKNPTIVGNIEEWNI